MEGFITIAEVSARTNVSIPTLNRYIRELKKDDSKGYGNMMREVKGGKGRKRKLYDAIDFVAFILAYSEQKEKIKNANLKKGKNDTGIGEEEAKKHRNKIQSNVLIKKTKQKETYPLTSNTKINLIDIENPMEVMSILKSICDLMLTGSYSLKGACEEMGLNINHFFKLTSVNEETLELWENTLARWKLEQGLEMEYLINTRLFDRLKTTNTVKVTTKYRYQEGWDEDGNIIHKSVPIERTEVEEPFIPTSADILAGKKLLLEMQHEANKRGMSETPQYASNMDDEELKAEIESLDKQLDEMLKIEE